MPEWKDWDGKRTYMLIVEKDEDVSKREREGRARTIDQVCGR